VPRLKGRSSAGVVAASAVVRLLVGLLALGALVLFGSAPEGAPAPPFLLLVLGALAGVVAFSSQRQPRVTHG